MAAYKCGIEWSKEQSRDGGAVQARKSASERDEIGKKECSVWESMNK